MKPVRLLNDAVWCDQANDYYKKSGFADRLITTTEEDSFDSQNALRAIQERLGI